MPPDDVAATRAAVAALTEFLAEREAGSTRPMGSYLQTLIDDEGVGALAQGYFGLLRLSALLLPGAAAAEGVGEQELLSAIGLRLAMQEDP